MPKLRKRKTGTGFVYVIDFRYEGKRRVLSLKTSNRKVAEKVKSDIETKIATGVFRLETHDERDMRLSELFQTYFDGVQGTKGVHTLMVEKYRTGSFLKVVGDITIRSIRIETLERWRAQRLNSVRPASFNGELRILKTVFNKAVEYGFVQANPFKKIKKVREEQKRLYLIAEEIKKVMDYLDLKSRNGRNREHREMARKFKLLCEVLLGTGMRRSELLNTTIDQVDFERNIILLERTKGKKRREVPMTERVAEILHQLSPTLFGDMTANQVTRRFTECAKTVGLEGMKLHSLRHTFGTYLIAMGYDITVAKELLGHEEINTTMIYAKADTRLLNDAVRSMGELGKSGYKMVTRGALEIEKAPTENLVSVSASSD